MCGICGIYNTDKDKSVSKETLIKMRDMLIHRGPDDFGEFTDNNVGLAMRRLKIIDLDTGHQPIHNEDKTIWIIFNGEIYNFLELREDLIKNRHKFYTKSDTEVIIHLYEEKGSACVNRLNGMFAFAIWDIKKKRLILARDRMGQKPLYYQFKDGEFIFASEMKSLLMHPSISRQLDLDSLSDYLTFAYIPAPRTIFKGINKLPAAHILIIENGKLTTERYWSIHFGSQKQINESTAMETLLKLLNASVKRHMISDVPLGIFLSGGIDSSTIAAIAAQMGGRKLETFSISFKDKSFDESKYSNLVANYIGSEHHEMEFNEKDCLNIIPYIYDIIDEPFADASILPTYILSGFSRKYVTVILGGDGGDELFAGYPTHIAHYFTDRVYLKLPFLVRKGILEFIARKMPTSFNNFSLDFKIKMFIAGVNAIPEVRHQLWMGSFSPQEKNKLFATVPKSYLEHNNGFDPILANTQKLSNTMSSILQERILFQDMTFYLQDDILTKVDRASMANSLEVRSPFLDCDLVEFVNSLNFNLKLRGLKSKFIFKKMLLAKKILPSQIINRPKKGFGIPLAKWINKELKNVISDVLSEKNVKNAGLFNYSYIQQILKEHFNCKRDNGKAIWTVFMFELWRKKYLN